MHCGIVFVDCLFLFTIFKIVAYRAGDLSSNPSKPDNFVIHNTKNVNIILVIDSLLSTKTFYKKIKLVNKNKKTPK